MVDEGITTFDMEKYLRGWAAISQSVREFWGDPERDDALYALDNSVTKPIPGAGHGGLSEMLAKSNEEDLRVIASALWHERQGWRQRALAAEARVLE